MNSRARGYRNHPYRIPVRTAGLGAALAMILDAAAAEAVEMDQPPDAAKLESTGRPSDVSQGAGDAIEDGIDPAEDVLDSPAASAELPAPAPEPAAEAPRTVPPAAATPPIPSPPPPAPRGVDSIGSISVGHPHQGHLFNAVRMPKDPRWAVSAPQHAFGTEETILGLIHVIRRVNELFPRTPPVMIGSISPERGGYAPPHKSHQSGRDVDLYFYYKPNTTKWWAPAGPHNLDRPRTWALLRAVITETEVDFVLIDRSVQALLEEYALSIGENRQWIHDIFHGSGRYPQPLVKHVPGHRAHMHIRFVSRTSRERGSLAYDGLVDLGHIDLPSKEIVHTVSAGETLGEIAERYRTTVERLMAQNQLTSTTIRTGQVLRIRDRKDLRDARAPVVVPRRRLPPGEQKSTDATLAALADLERRLWDVGRNATSSAASRPGESRAKKTR